MKKTNIRINNHFIIEHNQKFYLSSIDSTDEWKIKHNNLESFKEKDVTSRLKQLMDEHNIYSNVNFFITMNNKKEEKKVINLTGGS